MDACNSSYCTTTTTMNAVELALHQLRLSRPNPNNNQPTNKSSPSFHRHCHHHSHNQCSHDDENCCHQHDRQPKIKKCGASSLFERKQSSRLRASYEKLRAVQFMTTYWKSPDGNTTNLLGCRHYARACKLFAKCCNIWVSCRRCHDEALGDHHTLDRHAVEKVMCMHCNTEQPVSDSCVNCGNRFARYFCSVCNFFENAPDRPVYHCPHCGICRRGRGLGIDNFHCNQCGACVSMQSKDHHKCIRRGLHAPCPVCREDMFTSTEPSVYMRCGHSMHASCFREYTKTYFKCPYCAVSLTDMSDYYKRIDNIVENTPTQVDAQSVETTRTSILCNDCGKRSIVRQPSNSMYHKCAAGDGCPSYNTRVLGPPLE